MARSPVLAAGGIVLRQARPPLIAVVRLRKGEWVLPKGKLDDGETARDAAMREVWEETGHDVFVHEFLGTLAYDAGGRSKIVHYWRMEASGKPTRELMDDVSAVDWLTLEAAVERLSRDHERAFLANVGPLALESARRSKERKPATPEKPRRRRIVAPRPAPVSPAPVAPAPLAPLADESVPAIERAPRVVEQEAVDPSSAVAIEPVIEEAHDAAVESDAIASSGMSADPISFEERAAISEQALRVGVMQRVRSWLRRAG
jgi:8-oxo-dGTP diphosphatase